MFDLATIAGAALLLAILASTSFLLLFLLRDTRLKSEPAQHMQTDLVNMMILFQTMRDILSEQKDLARQFNESLDKKVGTVRALVESAQEERMELRTAQREIAALLEKTRQELVGLQGHIARQGPAEARDAPPTDPPSALNVEIPLPARDDSPGERPALHVVGQEKDDAGDDLIDGWTGIDFVGDEPRREDYVEPEPVSEKPEDAAAARDAFRALLDLDSPPLPPKTAPARGPDASTALSGNGRGNALPMQRRVYEYSDAGMTVPQIAGELGVGKGEVRLILSLRRDRER